jgi:hypothetical protein
MKPSHKKRTGKWQKDKLMEERKLGKPRERSRNPRSLQKQRT